MFSETAHDFGRVLDTCSLTHRFAFKNTGSAPLRIASVKASCGCTTTELTQKELLPGEEASICVTFNPKGRKGKEQNHVLVQSNDPVKSSIELEITGEVIPTIEVQPPFLHLGPLPPDRRTTATVTVTGRTESFAVTSVSVDSRYLTARVVRTENPHSGEKILHKATVEIGLEPCAPVGPLRGHLLVHTLGGADPVADVPFFAHILGDIEATPKHLFIPTHEPGKPYECEVSLATRSGRGFKIKAVNLDQSPHANLILEVKTIVNGAAAKRRIRLSGVTPRQEGVLRAALQITTDVPGEEHITIPLHAFISAAPQSQQ
jgi:hypothetical protein